MQGIRIIRNTTRTVACVAWITQLLQQNQTLPHRAIHILTTHLDVAEHIKPITDFCFNLASHWPYLNRAVSDLRF